MTFVCPESCFCGLRICRAVLFVRHRPDSVFRITVVPCSSLFHLRDSVAHRTAPHRVVIAGHRSALREAPVAITVFPFSAAPLTAAVLPVTTVIAAAVTLVATVITTAVALIPTVITTATTLVAAVIAATVPFITAVIAAAVTRIMAVIAAAIPFFPAITAATAIRYSRGYARTMRRSSVSVSAITAQQYK